MAPVLNMYISFMLQRYLNTASERLFTAIVIVCYITEY